ncbi:beta/gamma crystallin domain-containing protein [Chitinivorax sp. B]|uniref:beta/gamma crystallin domain-containing protein n=1 Tax=Chitinivorax sp. B TaxID=2502235 RepID=UPI0010F81D6F|nr:beta/gamma crystallin domain-containing protein [Chitinivorax sp. B]
MKDRAEATEACFYGLKHFEGAPTCYAVGTEITFSAGDQLNDYYKSVRVGLNAKVVAWQHNNGTGIYREWVGDQPDITDIGGLSKFKVMSHTTLAIAVRFDDKTSTQPGLHHLLVQSFQVGEASSSTGDPAFKLVGFMPPDGPPVTTAVSVRNSITGVYVATGSIYFRWNNETKQVDVAEDNNFPSNMSWARASANEFILSLNHVNS